MLEIIGYMVAAYGAARLTVVALQSEEAPTKNRIVKTMVAAIGVGAMILLAVMLSNQSDQIAANL